jgi:hypothetical protein
MPSELGVPKRSAPQLCLGLALILGMPRSLRITLHVKHLKKFSRVFRGHLISMNFPSWKWRGISSSLRVKGKSHIRKLHVHWLHIKCHVMAFHGFYVVFCHKNACMCITLMPCHDIMHESFHNMSWHPCDTPLPFQKVFTTLQHLELVI